MASNNTNGQDLRGVKCRTCEAIGKHFEDACPERYKVRVFLYDTLNTAEQVNR